LQKNDRYLEQSTKRIKRVFDPINVGKIDKKRCNTFCSTRLVAQVSLERRMEVKRPRQIKANTTGLFADADERKKDYEPIKRSTEIRIKWCQLTLHASSAEHQ